MERRTIRYRRITIGGTLDRGVMMDKQMGVYPLHIEIRV